MPKPFSFLCYTSSKTIPIVTTFPATKNGYITFGSFNCMPKINKKVIKTWSKILKRAPHSKIILKCRSFACKETIEKEYYLLILFINIIIRYFNILFIIYINY